MVGSAYEAIKEVVWDELKAHFRPEFLNRIDEVVVFHALQSQHIEKSPPFRSNDCRSAFMNKKCNWKSRPRLSLN